MPTIPKPVLTLMSITCSLVMVAVVKQNELWLLTKLLWNGQAYSEGWTYTVAIFVTARSTTMSFTGKPQNKHNSQRFIQFYSYKKKYAALTIKRFLQKKELCKDFKTCLNATLHQPFYKKMLFVQKKEDIHINTSIKNWYFVSS